ncbi:MAG: MMPL family transporter, partial [Clostridia bacterium]|nr:MMPL family transporter [Clostridia bacterium]
AKEELADPRDAMKKAVNDAFPTIITSGVIMSAAGFIIAFMTTDIYVGGIGLAVGRGALTSVILVLTVLPQVILYGNKLIEKTTVGFKKHKNRVSDNRKQSS